MSQTFLNTGTQTGNFDDLVNFIQRISYELTPTFSSFGKDRAKAILHEWPTQTLKAGAQNRRAEGYTPTFAAGDVQLRVRQTNPVQITALPFSVSGSQDAVNKAGLGESSEYEYQKDLRFKELAKDNNFAIIRETRVTRDGDAGTVPQMDGVLAWATGTRYINLEQPALITEDLFNQVAEAIYESSGLKADTVVCPGFQRRMITRWSTPTRTNEGGVKEYTNAINVYHGDYGTVAIVHDLDMPADEIAVFPKSVMKAAFLRPVEHYELGRTNDTRRGYVLSEFTLRVDNPNAVGRINGLATSGS